MTADHNHAGERARRYAEHLALMVRAETVSVGPGESCAKFLALHQVLETLYPLTHACLEKQVIGAASLLYRWPGRQAALQHEPVVLMAHQDVVEATGPWTHPPFAGVVDQEWVWGRGSIDDKGPLCAIFEAVEARLAAGFTPERDIWIVSSHDEEPMGTGAAEMVRHLSAQQIRPLLVLDEGGAIIDRLFPGVEGKAAVIGVTEKGYLNIRITARSAGGHASTPPRHSPLARLAKFITSIEEHPVFPAQFNTVTRSLFTCLAPRMKGLPRLIFRHLGLFGPFMPFILPALGGEAAAMVRTTCAFTMAQGSGAPNVLPESASVTANLRIAIHERSGQVLERLEKRARAYKLTIETLYGHEASPIAPQHGPGYDGLINSLKALFPDAVPMPYIMLAASDAHHMTEITDCVYRFCPFELNKTLRRSIHGLDERLPIASLCSAVDFYHDLVGRF